MAYIARRRLLLRRVWLAAGRGRSEGGDRSQRAAATNRQRWRNETKNWRRAGVRKIAYILKKSGFALLLGRFFPSLPVKERPEGKAEKGLSY